MKNILIVDDDLVSMSLLLSILDCNDYEVTFCSSSLQALKICQSFKFDLILLDIIMPVMNGYQVFYNLKETVLNNKTPIVFISCLDEPSDLLMAKKIGIDGYVTKPFIPELVYQKIEKYLDI